MRRMNPNTNVLVLGASGFIGSHLVPHLAGRGMNVFAQCLERDTYVEIPGVQWFVADLRDINAINSFPSECDSVIYLSQSPEFRNFPEGADSVFDINVAAALRAIEYARKAGARRFVFASTGSVYDQNGTPCRESDPLAVTEQRSFYAASKLAAELLLQPYMECMSVIILRLFMPYGQGLNPSMLLPELIRRVRERLPIDLHEQDGMLINPIYIDDLTQSIEKCLTYDKSITLNVAGSEAVSLRELSSHIGDILGIPPVFNIKPVPALVLVGEISLLKRELGFVPKTSIKEGLSLWVGQLAQSDNNKP